MEVKRTSFQSDLHSLIPLEQAIAELVKRDTRKERARVLVSLCEGETLETVTHSYRME
jgi:hypothetical protein